MRSPYLACALSLCILFTACTSPSVSRRTEVAENSPVLPTTLIKYRRLPMLNDFVFDYPESIRRDLEGNYLVLDTGNHRLSIFNPSMKFIRQIGQIGQGPDDLYTPTDYVIDAQRQIHVLDAGNSRIEVFDSSGAHVGVIPVDSKSLVLAVNSRGEVLLNQPVKGKSISVYSQKGALLRQFGELMTLSHAYPGRDDDEKYRVPLSRVQMVTDQQDNVYVCYTFAPIVQKYDYSGNLIWERRLAGTEVDFLVDKFWNDRNAVYTKNVDGIQMGVICADIARDERTGKIYILLGNRAIFIANEPVDTLQVARDVERGPVLRSITVEEGQVYVNDRVACYKIDFVSPQTAN